MKSSPTYRRNAHDVAAFGNALYQFLQVMEPHSDGFFGDSPRTWTPRAGQEAEAGRLRAEVDLLTGRAAYAFAAAGSVIDFKPRGAFEWQTIPVNPAASWPTILGSDPRFDVDVILACARQAVGILEMKAEEAEEYESRPVRRALGRLARLTGSGLRPAARWTIRGAGGLILVVAGAGLTHWLGWT